MHKICFQPRYATEIPEVVKKSFYIAESGRPGPVLIDIPKDVQQDVTEIPFPDLIKVRGYKPMVDPDLSNVGKAVELLVSARSNQSYHGRRWSYFVRLSQNFSSKLN